MFENARDIYDYSEHSFELWADVELYKAREEIKSAMRSDAFYPKGKGDETLMRVESEMIRRGLVLKN